MARASKIHCPKGIPMATRGDGINEMEQPCMGQNYNPQTLIYNMVSHTLEAPSQK